jgi:hypothetical protein
MKHTLLALCLLITPAAAETPAAPDDVDQGLSLLQEGAKLLFRGFMAEVEPSMNDLSAAIAAAGPQIMDLLAKIDDLQNYHAPEILENGDILIRRKTPAELKLEELQGPATDL